ncbi:nucleotidyltransferase family protein [Robertmurraya kyonggiensis]|uniref:Nucleotidyltransferase family protein n=1 Tax=Robertmurraya kyonggiensis TaxID=1037680 RepID=A0A4U1D1N6_9BACI|nr:NTP transferase domain-containing protein [Robertmurraya kyonggiensis]TKC16121.1 nucleotidyltransferase family protein [Robertmurraya kyonggiensis]
MEAIILAAGYSSRAKDFKMLLPLGKKSILEHTISKFEGVCERVIVVGGHNSNFLQEAISKINSIKIKYVLNENFDLGMFSSILKGCEEIRAPEFFITPGDCPLVKKETIKILARTEGEVVIPSFEYRGGHPIKLSSEIGHAILAAEANSNLRMILQDFDKKYVNVDDPGVLMDVDTPEDYKRVLEYYEERMK